MLIFPTNTDRLCEAQSRAKCDQVASITENNKIYRFKKNALKQNQKLLPHGKHADGVINQDNLVLNLRH